MVLVDRMVGWLYAVMERRGTRGGRVSDRNRNMG